MSRRELESLTRRYVAEIIDAIGPEKDVPAFALAPMRRGLAESLEISRAVLAAGD